MNLVYAIVGKTDSKGKSIGYRERDSESWLEEPDRNDAYLFELGCNLLFLTDLWHVSSGHAEARSRIFHGDTVALFIRLFEESLRTRNLGSVLVNRFEQYFDILQSGNSRADTMRLLFTELAKRCAADAVPVAYDFKRDFQS